MDFLKMKKFKLGSLIFLVIFVLIYIKAINYISNLESEKVQSIILETECLFYLITFIAFLALLIIFHKPLLKNLKHIKKNAWMIILIIFILAFAVREIVPPKTTRLFFDEDIYLDMAKQIVTSAKSCLCDYGNKTECFNCELMKWPVGHPFLISIPFLIFGYSDLVASHFMILLSSLSVVFVFLSAYLLFEDKRIAIFSSLVLALLPVHILWSVTSSADVTFSFFTSLVLFFSILSSKSNDLRIHAIALLALSLAVQAKTESIVLIPLYFITQIIMKRDYLKLVGKWSYTLMVVASILLMSIYFIHTLYFGRTDTWGSSGEKFGIEYMRSNLVSNLSYWFEAYAVTEKGAYDGKQLYQPIMFTIVALIGLVALIKNNPRKFLLLSSWFGALFLLYLSFYAGSIYYGVDVRYVLPQYIPFSLICGFGFFSILNLSGNKSDKNKFFIALISLMLIYFSIYALKMHVSPEQIQESHGARLYRDTVVNFASKQPDDCYFISHVSSIYSWLGKGHMQIWYVDKPEFDQILKEKSCVIFDEGYWCAIKAPESQTCVEFNKKYKLELLNRVNDTIEDKVYSFYKIVSS